MEQENQPQIELPNIRFDSSKVYVKFSNVHGRGVFAKEPIEAGSYIEIFPLTPASFRTKYQGDFNFVHYAFVNSACPCEECKRHGYLIYISSGFANMYNHQTPPKNNAKFIMDYKNLCGKVEALKIIKKDEEILVDYGPKFSFPDGEIINHDAPPTN